MKFKFNKDNFMHDFLASIVVFLVALPLCLGVAIASGVPPIYGLLSGVIGGLIVGSFTGSPLQVSGPAAGLAVMVFEIVQKHGLAGLSVICFFSGLFQIIGAFSKLGNAFKAVSPAVVKGMLSGIGVLILASQFHVMLDHAPKASGTENILTMPKALIDIFDISLGMQHIHAATLGLIAMGILVTWNIFRHRVKLPIPSPLIAIIATSLIAYFSKLQVNFIEIPENIFGELSFNLSGIASSFNLEMILGGLAIALVATTETLLCVSAVDSVKEGHKSNYNKELLAQGIGNTIAGLIGAMPITGVIVRSSANIEFGGRTKASTIMHGVWIAAFLFLFSEVLSFIPRSALAAILVYTGFKLIDFKATKKFFEFNKFEAVIYLATIGSIVTINLLYGVLIGYGLSLLHLIYKLNHLEVEVEINKKEEASNVININAHGVATFLSLPSLSKEIDQGLSKASGGVVLNFTNVRYVDTATKEYIENLQSNSKGKFEYVA